VSSACDKRQINRVASWTSMDEVVADLCLVPRVGCDEDNFAVANGHVQPGILLAVDPHYRRHVTYRKEGCEWEDEGCLCAALAGEQEQGGAS
jgi:hypothetical protein